MKGRGQVLLLAVIILASAVLYALSVLKYSHPRAVLIRDYVQAAEVVQLARVWIKSGLCPLCIKQTSLLLYKLNKTYSLNIPALTNDTFKNISLNITSGFANYTVIFYTSKGPYVRVLAYYEYEYVNSYFRRIGAEEVLVYNYTLRYYHIYDGPWGRILLYPQLIDVYLNLDLRYLGNGTWIVGIPVNMTWRLIDKFEIPIKIGR
ncbi:MAG: hypothetical protein DRJ52_04050 [Thermoprotei archaeon]|nr:MAG: hypothetical protein DRJ52_04050 [Thermoprotei archaeon]RLE97324.1 MAG: hypothetical protein DRJ63_09305 [Thermoprotei archaeon]